jgi:hypothetical protein
VIRLVTIVVTLVAASIVLVAPGLASTQTLAACPTGWGSLPENDPAMGTGEIDNLRAGVNTCFDRFVVEIDGPSAGYRAEYVANVTADGSGNVVNLQNSPAKIQLIVRHPWFSGPAVGAKVVSVNGFPVFRDLRYAGSFEGQTTFGIGVRARLPFRVFELPGGHSRIVIDVARTW